MKQVTSKEFFDVIGELDVTVTPKGNYPYRTDFCYRTGERVGYAQGVIVGGLKIDKYYLCD